MNLFKFQSSIFNRPQDRSARPPRGFTLMELLVVMGIIILLFTVGLPSLNGLLTSGRAEAGLTAVSAGASAARAFAISEEKPFLADLDTTTIGDQTADAMGDGYSGAAVLVTPAWEMRLVRNVQDAVNGGNNSLELSSRNGYTDIEGREYIQIPSGAAVVGIARNGPNLNDLILLPPPFAIRFDRSGSLIAGQTGNRLVYYDADYDSAYETSVARDNNPYGGGEYQPVQWDPASPAYMDLGDFEPDNSSDSPDPRDTFATTQLEEKYEGRHKLPFEQIESVIGVMAFDYSAFKDAGYALDASWLIDGQLEETTGDPATDPWQWILENGQPLLLNRQTGTVIKEQG